MKLSDIALDTEGIENGVWVDDIPKLPGLRLKVRGSRSKKWRQLTRKLLEAARMRRSASLLDEDENEKMQTSLLLHAGLVDWDGVERDDGEKIPFNVIDAEKILTDPQYAFFREGVAWACDVASDRRAAEREDAAKN